MSENEASIAVVTGTSTFDPHTDCIKCRRPCKGEGEYMAVIYPGQKTLLAHMACVPPDLRPTRRVQ